jgi:opacity protein-like surface antigen
MKTIISLFACLALSATYLAPASAATSTLTVKMSAQNGSGENGTATLTQAGSDVKVVIAIPNGPAGPQPAHIHDGTCAGIQGVAYPLTSIASGDSTTTVKGVTIDQLLAGKYAINVHESTSNLGKYVSCGNIVKPSTSM